MRCSLRTRRCDGFTLIEMMAVMVLIGMLAALVMPSMQRWFAGLDTRVESADMASRLRRLYARTALLSQDFVLTPETAGMALSDGAAALALPAGWTLAAGQALTLRSSGICAPGSLTLRSPAATLVLRIASPDCDVRVERLADREVP